MTDKYKDDILKLISEKGPLGVNAIQRELGYPLSTLQKYLHKQSYFKINDDKKWDLPENHVADIKSNTLSIMTDLIETNIKLIQSQVEEIQQSLHSALSPISTLKRGVSALTLPVADKSTNIPNIHPLLFESDKNIQTALMVIKKYVQKVPEKYQDLLKNVDLYKLVIEMGSIYLNSTFNSEIASLLLEKTDELSDDMIQVLKNYQKET